MTPPTAPTRETDSTPSADAPDSTAERLEHEAADAADEFRATVAEILERLDGVRELADEVREARATFELRRTEVELYAEAHEIDVDLPDLDLEATIAKVESALEDLDAIRVRGDTIAEREARSAGTNISKLRQAVREGDVEAVERRIEQLRRLLNDPAWLTDELVADAFLEPARERYRERLERDLVRQAVRVARSIGQGNPVPLRDENGEPVRFPASVTRLLEEQIDAPRDFRSLFLDAIEHPKYRDVSGRDLEAELADVASRLSDEELAEAVA